MKNLVTFFTLMWYGSEVFSLNLPGPRVYVVTPSSAKKTDEGRSAPFYYHNWMRRMDSPTNFTTTTTTTTPKVKTPDLIFAEFESDSKKNIRKLLEKERITTKAPTTRTTSIPIYVPDETMEPLISNYGLPLSTTEIKEQTHFDNNKDKTDYFSQYNNLYNNEEYLPAPVSRTPSTTTTPKLTQNPTTTAPATTSTVHLNEVQNIWQIIDNEKSIDHSGTWDEVQVSSDNDQSDDLGTKNYGNQSENDNNGNVQINENFSLPGFATNPVNGGENESRAIRTESDIHFPYVNLKPFQMKISKQPNSDKIYGKKGNNMYTSLDNFYDLKNPVRGEAQDVPLPQRQPIDRYNPAQPYLPNYGTKLQSSPVSPPMTATANLVPPPPPPPKTTGDDFPAPSSYELFPPYPPSPARPPPPSKPVSVYKPPVTSDASSSYDTFIAPAPPSARKPSVMYQPPVDSGDDYSVAPMSNDGPVDSGYQYRPPKPPSGSDFLPTLPPLKKPAGYSYDKPPMTVDEPPPMSEDDKPDFHGYHYDKPPAPEKPDFHGYHYDKPEASPPIDHPSPSYNHPSPPYGHDSDYPELMYNKPHGGMPDDMGAGDMKGGDDMGMMPPPPPPPEDSKPDVDDHGFPSDFPGDLKYHDFYEHGHDYHHHHHHTTTTTTTTTTEMPRVNRYSYYYLGKKLYYLPLYFSVYFIIYVGALIIKAVLRHKIVYPNSFRPNDQTASFFAKRSVDSWDLSNEQLHEITGKVTHAIGTAAEKYLNKKEAKNN